MNSTQWKQKWQCGSLAGAAAIALGSGEGRDCRTDGAFACAVFAGSFSEPPEIKGGIFTLDLLTQAGALIVSS